MNVVQFARSYGRALRFSMSTSQNLLTQLQSPQHAHTRAGGDVLDRDGEFFRGVVADSLQDEGRDQEADLLRNRDQHVVVHEGQVKPGRYTLHPFHQLFEQLPTFPTASGQDNSEWYAHEELPGIYGPRYTLWDRNYTESYPYGHHPIHFGEHAANYLDRELDAQENYGHLDPHTIEQARGVVSRIRAAPFEEPAE